MTRRSGQTRRLTGLVGKGGRHTVAMLSNCTMQLGTLCRRKIASLAGLAPHACESGTWKGARRIWGGRRKVREAFHIAALSASRRMSALIAMRDGMRANFSSSSMA